MSEEYTPLQMSFMLAIGEAREAGAKAERERIIVLLEKHLIPIAASGDDAEAFGWREGMRYAIACIKGENE